LTIGATAVLVPAASPPLGALSLFGLLRHKRA
jgi:hypothetical protein